MMKKFEEPKITVIAFAAYDVITASGDNLGGWHDGWNIKLPNVNDVSVN